MGKGNNGSLIKSIFRNYRPWWTLEEQEPENEKINLHWYQLRQNHILENLKEIFKTDLDYENCDYVVEEEEKKV